MSKVLVLAGGNSDEREVSLRSGTSVVSALIAAGYEVAQADPAKTLFNLESAVREAEVVVPMLHGIGGEDGTLQAKLEALGCTYVGADSSSSAHCFDKWRYKQTLMAAGLPTPKAELVDIAGFEASELARKPFVLKPNDGGSSVDTFIIRNPEHRHMDNIKAAFQRHPQMLVEELVEGTEITVGVLGDEVLPVIEIIPPLGEEFDYENKYNGKTQEICPPQHVDEATQKKAQNLALQIHTLLKVRDLSRTDMMIGPDGSLMVLETNTIPGMTDQSLLPKAAAEAGYDMPEVIRRLVEAARART